MLPLPFQMKEDQSSTDAQLKHSTKRKALMDDRISMKRYSTKQMALVEERISSWNMNGSVPILTFAGRGEYLSKIENNLLGSILCDQKHFFKTNIHPFSQVSPL